MGRKLRKKRRTMWKRLQDSKNPACKDKIPFDEIFSCMGKHYAGRPSAGMATSCELLNLDDLVKKSEPSHYEE